MVLITKYYICYFDTLPPYQILYVVSKHSGTGKLTININDIVMSELWLNRLVEVLSAE